MGCEDVAYGSAYDEVMCGESYMSAYDEVMCGEAYWSAYAAYEEVP